MRSFFLVIILFSFFSSPAKEKKTDTFYLNPTTIESDVIADQSLTFNSKEKEKVLYRYKNADDPSFADPLYGDTSWQKRRSFFSYDDLMAGKSGKGVAWFRVRLKADEALSKKTMGMKFTGAGAMEVYLDGSLLYRAGNFDTGGKHFYYALSSQPVFFSLPDTNVHVMAIRYENNDAKINDEEMWGLGTTIATANNIYKSGRGGMWVASWFLITLGTVFFTLFLMHFLMFLFYRGDYSNLYFALFTLSLSVLLYYVHYAYSSIFPIGSKPSTLIVSNATIVSTTALSAFIAALFSRRKIFLKIILLLGAVTVIVSYIDLQIESDFSSVMVGVLMLLSVGYALIMIIIAMVKKKPGAFILGSGIIIFFAIWITFVIMGYLGLLTHVNNTLGAVMTLSIISIPLSISAFLAWRFAYTSKNLSKQLTNVETLSAEKQSILENQNAHLENEVAIRTHQIAEEKKRSDDLLLNILPEEVAEELKLNGHSKAHRYDEVSVLFTDFVNFTQISEQLGVEELLDELNINFTTFDKIMEKHGLEKIKTIGDAYLAVCGVPVANEQHAKNAVNAALEILEFVQKRKQEAPYGLDIRIGINSGSLIAGIIGVKKFAYDIWGDTVNTAARMEQNSEAGKINISESTYALVRNDFICTHRGKLKAKGKGEMDMYFVEQSLN